MLRVDLIEVDSDEDVVLNLLVGGSGLAVYSKVEDEKRALLEAAFGSIPVKSMNESTFVLM